MLAFELQAAVHGGLSPELKQRLRAKSGTAAKEPTLPPGTRIVREWRGERHVINVTQDGFEHRGTVYDSLSEIARSITGTRWSGPRFFGLIPPQTKKAI
jgi:hypothetical protein